jgi:hypothetical protein
MSTFDEYTSRGDTWGALRSAATFSALWAIGASWSTAIRAIALELFPHESMDVVWVELAAAGTTTVFGLTISFIMTRCATRCYMSAREKEGVSHRDIKHVPNTTPRSQTFAPKYHS